MKKLFVLLLCVVLSCSSLFPSVTEAAQVSDVKTTDSKYKAIKWAVDNKIISTNAGNKFSPNANVTEYQLLRAIAKLDPNYYSSSYSEDEVYSYYSDLNVPLKWNGNVTRGQFAKLVAALNGMDLSTVEAVQYLYMNEITNGTSGKKTYDDYKPYNDLTRGELAVFLHRIDSNNILSYEGLQKSATGRDDDKVTLPPNFASSGTVTLKPPSNTGGTATQPPSSGNPYTNTVSQSEAVTIKSDSVIIANGYDSSLITIELKDKYGNEIPYEETLTYKVTSKQNTDLGKSPINQQTGSTFIVSDGGELNFYVEGKKSTTTLTDKITLELQNNSNSKFDHIRKIEIPITYEPRPEVRIEYEYFDPNQKDWDWGDAEKGPEPIQVTPPSENLFGDYKVVGIDKNKKIFIGRNIRTFELKEISYNIENNFQLNTFVHVNISDIFPPYLEIPGYFETGHTITMELFENTIEGYIYSDFNSLYVNYSILSNNKPNFIVSQQSNYLTVRMENVLKLIDVLPNNITINSYDSVKVVKGIYDNLPNYEKLLLMSDKTYADRMQKLIDANFLVDQLKQEQEKNPPVDPNAKHYSKITISMIEKGGSTATSFSGEAVVEFNGETRTVKFTNGIATLESDSNLAYGESEVSIQILSSSVTNSSDKNTFANLLDKPITKTVFTNPVFSDNRCERDVEVGFVVDQSGSMLKVDPENYVGAKTKQLIKQLNENSNVAVRFNTSGTLEDRGDAPTVTDEKPPIYQDKTIQGGTSIAKGLEKTYINFSGDNLPRYVVLLSDGKSSQNQINQIIKDAKDKNVTIHTVLVGKQSKSSITLMQQISDGTGGQFFYIEDVLDLHGIYQKIIDAILCGTTVSTDVCPIDNAFDEAVVKIRYPDLMMHATTNPVCRNVDKVSVRFSSKHGQYQYDLIDRGQGVFRANHPAQMHQTYDLILDVEFLAYDVNGNLVGKKTVQADYLK
ncbi:S-layer family protein [Ureibacillus xyleni]|uniref:S-layer family protein n=1 Tax=Ureibacillus xyleni TaxID=614648 RepID=A0A285S6C3_9BACL|nr:S-layer homology domain-containing protein [Ureibacillus xyleni]SOC02646.1 S-layer family protein [Ureibacillus xyleni]